MGIVAWRIRSMQKVMSACLAHDDFRHLLEAHNDWRDHNSVVSGDVDHAFVPGEVFSAYAYQRFSEALRERADVLVQVRAESVAAIGRHAQGGLVVVSGDGDRARFDAVFLATGYGLREIDEGDAGVTGAKEVQVIGGGVHAAAACAVGNRLRIVGSALSRYAPRRLPPSA